MWKWILRIRREITIFLFLLLCLYVFNQINKQTTLTSRQNTDNAQFTGNGLVETKLSRIRIRRHANFRQKRFIGVKTKRGKEKDNIQGVKIKPVVNVKQKPRTRPRVIIKKHAMFRQKIFVKPRSKKQMSKTNGAVNDNKIPNNQWLL
jgi:hypothetical protein